jgi:uncharacterized RDD family membrane protein YckC
MVLEIAGAPPAFCPYCGQGLSKSTITAPPPEATGRDEFNASTLAPRDGTAVDILLGAPARTVGKYRLIRSLGSGGMGTVFMAAHVETGNHVAVKLISRELAATKDGLQRFRQEGRLASAIMHPRCVFVLAADEADGQSYIVMELMPGDTLKDLVEQNGPLSLNDGIAKTLDVIDGLMEAHRLEVIHRDVKPSNCFLEANGRVKVGDFGLAKSLVGPGKAHLTRTGTFLGTPHFASPEQVKSEPLNSQTDVYSVAATMYYLFTGQPPFGAGKDMAATLARIVCDPPESIRKFRPELPVALDRVVLKGLDRDRERRYQDLQELRDALVAVQPQAMTRGGLWVRLGAFLADIAILTAVFWTIKAIIAAAAGLFGAPEQTRLALALGIGEPITALLWLGYFGIGERIWGGTPGKRWLRLRVRTGDSGEKPSVRHVVKRTLVAFALFQLGWLLAPAVLYALSFKIGGPELVAGPWRLALAWGWFGVGALLAVATMRRRDAYRGLHEILSDTRVVRLPSPKKRPRPLSTLGWVLYLKRGGRLTRSAGATATLPDKLGGFAIRGALHWTTDHKVLLGEDVSLGRKVLLCARSPDAPGLDAKRLQIDRTTRIRWLGSGTEKHLHWNAFLAPRGCPLPELIVSEKRLPWSEVRAMLEQLSEELVAAAADHTLPPQLTCDDVWVQLDGQVQLVDLPTESSTGGPSETDAETPDSRGLRLLRQVAVLALEGRMPAPDERPKPILAPMPEHAHRILNRLAGIDDPYTTVEQLRADLAATADQPLEVGPAQRGTQLALQTAFLLPGLALMFLPGMVLPNVWDGREPIGDLSPRELYDRVAWTAIGAALLWPLLWVCWSAAARGGLSYALTGIALQDGAGRPAPRWRCGLRSLVVWAPLAMLLVTTYWWPTWFDLPESPASFQFAWLWCWAILGVILAFGALHTARAPQRLLCDHWTDIHFVPR